MKKALVYCLVVFTALSACGRGTNTQPAQLGRKPEIRPDYQEVTIPSNIAPLNFTILEKGEHFRISVTASDGSVLTLYSSDSAVRFPLKEWKRMLGVSKGSFLSIEVTADGGAAGASLFKPFRFYVDQDPVDPWLCYRLLYPGYRSWVEMKIVQRSLEDFTEYPVFENQLLENNCVNCHSLNRNDPGQFMLHVRGSKGGTYFLDGNKLSRVSLKTKEMAANAVYPDWHPSGRYLAFSSNKTVQSFHMRPEKNIEVYDLFSSLVIYDRQKNEIFPFTGKDSVKYMETFPCWSADGSWLYFCRAPQVQKGDDYTAVRYDLYRRSFDTLTGRSGAAELVFDARSKGKSVSFPELSPDGKYLVFTLHDYGTFSIWHKEADLYLIDLQNGSVRQMSLNSPATESWHCWSSDSKWMVFSSKRGDGLTARPYIARVFSADSTGKPFLLPQEDPSLSGRLDKTFNRPEFMKGKLDADPRDFAREAGQKTITPHWVEKDK